MALQDDRPEGLTDLAERFAISRQGASVYCQGMGKRRSRVDPNQIEDVFAVWLRMRCGSQTMIGYGSRHEAVMEAVLWTLEIGEAIRTKMEELVAAMRREPVDPSE